MITLCDRMVYFSPLLLLFFGKKIFFVMLRMNLLVITYTHFYLLASPHATGMVDQIPPEELRRGLMLLSKVREWLSRNIIGRSVRPSVSSQSHSQSIN